MNETDISYIRLRCLDEARRQIEGGKNDDVLVIADKIADWIFDGTYYPP